MITGSQIRAARALVKFTAQDLAEKAGVGLMTVRRSEASDNDTPNINKPNLVAIKNTLEASASRSSEAVPLSRHHITYRLLTGPSPSLTLSPPQPQREKSL
jgi:transcriptional regulator with XRE-family HTH domain